VLEALKNAQRNEESPVGTWLYFIGEANNCHR